MLLVSLALLAGAAYAELQGALPQNCTAVTTQAGKSTWCPCSFKCIDGTRVGDPGQCLHFYDYPQVCGELDKEPSCSKTQALDFDFLEDVDDFGHPAPGLGSCSDTVDEPCRNPDSMVWHKQNVSWKCCSCPEGFIAGAPRCPPANITHVPNWGQCWRCSEPEEELVEYEYSFYKCVTKCIPSDSSCDFYQRLEKNHGCGQRGYPLKYGYANCQKYAAAASKFSSKGQAWIKKVRKCLQQALLPDCKDQSVSCAAVQEHAFGSHASCYIKNGFCDLPKSDWLTVLETVGWDLVWPLNVIAEAAEVGAGCAKLYDTYFERWEKKVEKGVKDKIREAVCGAIPSWCS